MKFNKFNHILGTLQNSNSTIYSSRQVLFLKEYAEYLQLNLEVIIFPLHVMLHTGHCGMKRSFSVNHVSGKKNMLQKFSWGKCGMCSWTNDFKHVEWRHIMRWKLKLHSIIYELIFPSQLMHWICCTKTDSIVWKLFKK